MANATGREVAIATAVVRSSHERPSFSELLRLKRESFGHKGLSLFFRLIWHPFNDVIGCDLIRRDDLVKNFATGELVGIIFQ